MGRVDGKVALVTGAARGIGLAVADLLAREGARVIATDIRDETGAAAAGMIAGDAAYRRLDVRREEDWRQVVEWIVETYGRLDVLVNNAGITGFEDDPAPQDPEHASLESWRAVHATNLDGVFLGCKHAIRAMRAHGAGSIVNIGSRSGMVGIPGAAAYASSKAAIRNHTRTVALYCAAEGLAVRCNVVQPAAILTPMWEPMLGDGPDREDRMRALTRDTPLGRFGTPWEVAQAVLHLASDESAYTTGAEMVLDGGLLAGSAARPERAESSSE
ncbi:MAG: putative short-chain dehydrogenase/reductase [Gemmatimonadetes bacterium]|nr:putative short-chain dehydrogenase/reductase [Gemmatimonadota bacterium]